MIQSKSINNSGTMHENLEGDFAKKLEFYISCSVVHEIALQ